MARAVRVSLAALSFVLWATGAWAQGATGRFFLGPYRWSPTLLVREAGIDTNVFNVPSTEERREDRYIVFQPQIDGTLSVFLEPIALYHRSDMHDDGDGPWASRYAAPNTRLRMNPYVPGASFTIDTTLPPASASPFVVSIVSWLVSGV